MPLRDHFRPPVVQDCPWESFHSAWANAMVVQFNGGLLPPGFRALPNLHMGTRAAVDIATFHEEDRSGAGRASGGDGGNGRQTATAVWSPPRAIVSEEVDFADRDTFEVVVVDSLQRRLVAAIELVSPANKDRPANRRDFAIKCASYLQQQIALVVVDAVTTRRESLHAELSRLLELSDAFRAAVASPLYAASYRLRLPGSAPRVLELWPAEMSLDEPLPTLPLWLGEDLALPLNLEESYQAAVDWVRLAE